MLAFFRKNQRFFFIIVTVVIVVSFTFFGTFSTLSKDQEIPDHPVVTGIDGSAIMQRDLGTLCRLISTSALDRASIQKGQAPNLLNDSVIEKDLIASGMAMMLARRYFEELKPDFEARLAKIKQYRPYIHPQNPTVSATAIWGHFMPSINQHLALLKAKSDQFTLETLAVLFQLYLDQTMLPSDFLKMALSQQAQQMGLQPDSVLAYSDLSLFGFHSLEDWFGPRFIELMGQFIINAAQFAKENGYQVSNEAVRSELFTNIVNQYRELYREQSIQAEEIDAYYKNQVYQIAGDEPHLLDSWRQVMLFRSLFQDVGNSVFVDALPFQQFHRYAKEASKIDLYELPDHLRFRDLLDLCKFQIYIEAISLDQTFRKNSLKVPEHLSTVDQVEKKTPELVEQMVEVEYAQVTKEDLRRQISLKETWEWQVQDLCWDQLKKQFPQVNANLAQTSNERMHQLDQLDQETRLKIDAFSQNHLIDQHPDRVAAALDRAALRQISFGLRGAGKLGPFEKVKDQRRFVDLLRTANLSCEEKQFYTYCDDQQTFYKIAVLKRNPERAILTFAQAMKDGTLTQMLDKRLEEAYPDVRRKNSVAFQKHDGNWKPFGEVKEKIARCVFADLLKNIESCQEQLAANLSQVGELPSSFYTQYRFYPFLNEVKNLLETHNSADLWIKQDAEQEGDLHTQFKLVKTTTAIDRSSDYAFAKEQMFSIPVNSWSGVEIGRQGTLAFYQILGREQSGSQAAQEIDKGHQLLSMDAKKSFLVDLLNQIQEKKAIVLSPISGEKI